MGLGKYGSRGRQILKAGSPASLAKMVTSVFRGRPCLKGIRQNRLEHPGDVYLWPEHTSHNIHMCIHSKYNFKKQSNYIIKKRC